MNAEDILPDLQPDESAYDPVAELTSLTQANAERINAMSQQGAALVDPNTLITSMITNALLEEILRAVAGDGTVVRVLLDTHKQIADLLTSAASQVTQARLAAPAGPVHNGRVTRNGRIT